jgi:aminoglycoside 3-N-acetyltransferase
VAAFPTTRDGLERSLVTRSSLARSLRTAGLADGDVVCAHVGLSRLGYVAGAGQAVIEAMGDAVGPRGTIMMPAFTGDLSDPAQWRVPPVPPDWVEPIRAEMPVYDPMRTPTRQMGVVAELFRTWPGVRRGPHPHSSFAATGPRAADLVDRHPLDYRFGPASPLGKLAALDGKVLMLGAGPQRASIVYLAQFLSGIGAETTKTYPVLVGGERRWVECRDIAVDNRLVGSGVTYLLRRGVARAVPAGDGDAVVFAVRQALAALLDWGWGDAGIDAAVVRPRGALPAAWSDWLN